MLEQSLLIRVGYGHERSIVSLAYKQYVVMFIRRPFPRRLGEM